MFDNKQLKSILNYDPDTGIFRWVNPTNKRIRIGEVAGCFDNDYIRIKIHGKKYLAHRLAWFYINDEWVELIDHINSNRSDNRIINLRKATKSENGMNRGKNLNNLSGHKGISKTRNNKYVARFSINRKTVFRKTFDNLPEAIVAYREASIKYHGEFTYEYYLP
jgi:hypothetical protein